MDVGVRRGAELSTDHHLVVCTLRLSSSNETQRRKPQDRIRIRWEVLTVEVARRNFADNVDRRFSQVLSAKVDAETEWLLFRTATLEAATEACGVKHVGPLIGQKRTAWWTKDVRAAVAEKKAAYRAWIGWQRVENR